MSRTAPMRILELRSVLGTGGGPEKTIMLGAAHANRDVCEVVVCYLRDRRDAAYQPAHTATALGIDYAEIDERHSFDVGIWRQLRQVIRSRRIDLVHSHDHKTDFLALLLAWRTGVLALATAHGWVGQTPRERYCYYPVDRRLLARFPRVIAVSTDIKETLVRCGAVPERITVILNSIDPDAFKRSADRRQEMRQALGYGASDLVIGAVGRLERQKRFDLLLDALAPVLRARPQLRLTIAGDGSLREALNAQARTMGLGAQTRLLGHRTDVADLHQAFDLYVQSSEYEGTPNTVLEAMAMETPLVATDVGGTRELARDGVDGLIVPKHDPQQLRAAIEAALDQPEAARRRATAARNRVVKELSFAARTRRLEEIYVELARREGRVTSVAVLTSV